MRFPKGSRSWFDLTFPVRSKLNGLLNRARRAVAKGRYQKPPDWCRRIAFSPQLLLEPRIRKCFASWPIEITFAKLTELTLDDFDLVVPLEIDDARWLAAQSDFNECNAIPMPPVEVIDLCNDKLAFDSALASLGFGRHAALRHSTAYPYVLKPRREAASVGTHIVRDEVDEQSLSTQLHDPDYFTQRLVPGRKEYATHLNFTDGRVVSELTVEYTFATNQPIKFRDRALRRYTRCPDLTTLVAILRALNYEGLCCFNYKVLDGVGPVVFELNPRFGGTLCEYFFAFVGAISYPRKSVSRAGAGGRSPDRPAGLEPPSPLGAALPSAG
jgi:hypothetical protein